MALERTILFITGGNTGLGYEAVRALAASSVAYEILLGSRSADKGQQAVDSAIKEFPAVKDRISTIPIDVESDESIQASFDTIKSKYGRLDVLINNAGAYIRHHRNHQRIILHGANTDLGAAFDQHITSGKMSMREAWNQSWNVNTTGSQVMTATFVPLLLQSKNPRLLFIASGTSSFGFSEIEGLPINRPPVAGWPKTDLVPQNNIVAYRSSKAGLNMMMK